MEQAVIWILGIIAFIILEAVTYQLVSIWFAIGALGGMIAAFSGVNFYVQMAVFIAVSFICILCLRPISMTTLMYSKVKRLLLKKLRV